MLLRLQLTPHIGVQLADEHGAGVFHRRLVVVRRGWTLHIVYRIRSDDLLIEYVDPPWIRRTTL